MTTQHQIIAFCVLLTIAVPVGTFSAIKLIKKLTIPPVNNLNRRGDIELVDYIEPARPDYAYQPLDVVNPNYMNYESYNWPDRVFTLWSDRVPTYYSRGPAPSYYSGGNPPSFNTIDRTFINSSLENNINLNLYFILIIILFLVFIIVIFYYKPIDNKLIDNKPIKYKPILTKNISTEDITFSYQYQQIHKGKNLLYGRYYSYILFSTWTIFDIQQWMNTFDDIDYFVTIELIGNSFPNSNINNARLILSWEFIVNKGSSPVLISTLIKTQTDQLIEIFNIELEHDFSEGIEGRQLILISFSELYI
jgi:hypothetical protein